MPMIRAIRHVVVTESIRVMEHFLGIFMSFVINLVTVNVAMFVSPREMTM